MPSASRASSTTPVQLASRPSSGGSGILVERGSASGGGGSRPAPASQVSCSARISAALSGSGLPRTRTSWWVATSCWMEGGRPQARVSSAEARACSSSMTGASTSNGVRRSPGSSARTRVQAAKPTSWSSPQRKACSASTRVRRQTARTTWAAALEWRARRAMATSWPGARKTLRWRAASSTRSRTPFTPSRTAAWWSVWMGEREE